VAGLPFLSSSRNDIQYRQSLDCWAPVSKNNKNLDFEQLAKLGWSENLEVSAVDAPCKTELERFVRRALTICGVIHQAAIFLASEYPTAFLTHTYGKYHLSLLPAP
jgi:hypothetical protein